jgi:tRNA(fMet)-specific endonuclease VapC
VKFLLDTDTLSYVAREANPILMARFRNVSPDDLALSVVTRGEIEFGLRANPPRAVTQKRVRGLLQSMPTLALSPNVAEHYSRVRHELAKMGKPISVNDMWIAAHALAEDRTIVTNNEREYARVPGLRVENWLR